ncbi:MAG: tyrosine-type recombinase/integrase [Alphaproteobacteria bacterium]|nr:tyrosine-type recombinase/integrase [Alphaproteobacteria bacterium]
MSDIKSARVTSATVNALQEGQTLRDIEVKGFGARRRSGAPSYFLQTRVNGRLRWMTIGRHGSPWTPAAARKEALRLLADIHDGHDPAHAKWTRRNAPRFAEVADAFLVDYGPKLKPRTREEYQRLIENALKPAFGMRHASDLSRADVTSFHNKLAATPRKANFALAVLSKIMSWAETQSIRPENTNPCTGIDRFRENQRQRFLHKAELMRLGEVLAQLEAGDEESPYVIAAIRLLLLTGARLNEILTLEWRYVDLDRSLILLPDSKTGQKPVFLNQAAAQVLRDLPRVSGNPFVIVGGGSTGRLINLQKPWRRIRAIAKLDDVRLHDLRHSFASLAAERGASLPLIGKLLGHSNPQTTQRYAHLVADSVREVNEGVGDQLIDLMRPSRERQ